MKTKLFLVQVMVDGNPTTPEIFADATTAGAYYESQVTDSMIGFRKKSNNESWAEYVQAFISYTYSKGLPFDPSDWTINWFEKEITNEDPIINTKLPVVLQEFDGFEIHPCHNIGDDCIEVCERDEAEFWSAYVHLTEGGVDCIADFHTEEQANTFVSFLESTLNLYRNPDEGIITWSVDDFEEKAREIEIAEIKDTDEDLGQELWDNPEQPIPHEHKLFDRSKFRSALQRMIKNHDCNNGIVWSDIEDYLDTDCRIIQLKRVH